MVIVLCICNSFSCQTCKFIQKEDVILHRNGDVLFHPFDRYFLFTKTITLNKTKTSLDFW